MKNDFMVYVVWRKDKRFKSPLYVGSSKCGIHRFFGNVKVMAHKHKIGLVEFHRCLRYSDALTLEGKLTHELHPTLDALRKPKQLAGSRGHTRTLNNNSIENRRRNYF